MNPLSIVQKVLLVLAGLSGSISILLGAIGAHWLKDKLNYWELHSFETGVKYQMYHTLALLIVVLLLDRFPSKVIEWSGYSFVIGIIVFSGSLYLLSLKSLLNMEKLSMLGPLTPIGGLTFIIGWLLLVIAVIINWRQS